MRIFYRVRDNGIEIVRCFGNDSKVVLPEKIHGTEVVQVAPYAFSGQKEKEEGNIRQYETEKSRLFSDSERLLAGTFIKEIIFPDTIKEIGKYVFYGCKCLERLQFSNGLTHIGGGAFTGCSGLRSLKVHMQNGNRSCVDEILGELWQRIDVTFCYGKDHTKAVLIFPEHYEEAVENTPARILYTQHHGSGNNYRQCFYNKEVDYNKYDSLFSVAAAWDEPGVLADMALCRLAYPYRLAEKYKTAYTNMIQQRYREIIPHLIKKESISEIKLLSAYSIWNQEMLEYAIELSSIERRTEILSLLMDEKQKSFPSKRKKYIL